MTTLDGITRAGRLVLARLLVSAKTGLTAAKVAADLSKLDAERFSAGKVAAALESLHARGYVEPVGPPLPAAKKPAARKRPSNKPPAPPKPPKPPAYGLTAAGRDAALRAAGLQRLPAKPTWTTLLGEHLLRVAVGATPQTPPLKTKAALAAHLLSRQFHLDVPVNTKLPAIIAATVCKTLGYPGVSDYKTLEVKVLERMLGSFTAAVCKTLGFPGVNDYKTLEARVLERILGTSVQLTPEAATEQFIRRRLGSKQGKVDEIRQAALRLWLTEDGRPGVETEVTAPQETPDALRVDAGDPVLGEFARQAVDAARHSRTGWFGDNKVFIGHAWRTYSAVGDGQPSLDLPRFKQQLLRANTAGLLELSRADLVALMDPADVRESETPYLNTSFHFILVERGRP